MHYYALALIPAQDGVVEAVTKVMGPWCEEDGENPNGWWDWWVIGGRWTGHLSEYDPVNDPRNWEKCFLCQGTGIRTDWRLKDPTYGCNGCGNKGTDIPPGMRLKHAPQWVRHEHDTIPVASLLRLYVRAPEKVEPYRFVTPTGSVGKENWTGQTFLKDEEYPTKFVAALRAHNDHLAVIVDYHT